jgi:predicted small secreted protein
MCAGWHDAYAVIPVPACAGINLRAGIQPPICSRDEDQFHNFFLGLGPCLRGDDGLNLGAQMKKVSLILATIAALAFAGCNTMQGIGKDVQKAGEKIEDASKKK